MSRLKTDGTQEEGGKVYYLLNENFWVEQVGFISWSEKQFVRAGRRLVEGLTVVRGRGWYNGLCIQAEV